MALLLPGLPAMGSPLASTVADPYRVLGLTAAASGAEIKAAYRALVKQHHPDAGGDEERIIALNAAWELLRDGERRRAYDLRYSRAPGPSSGSVGGRVARGPRSGQARAADEELSLWLQQVVAPIDRLLAQVINPFPAQLRELSADPYDDSLMEAFCAFLSQSQAKLEKVESLYRSRACPAGAQAFALNLYHCLSQVQDALRDLERYTMGYVDSYLRDGRELLREAKRLRSQLLAERRQLEL